MTIQERLDAALAKSKVVTDLEYDKYLRATEASRNEYFEEIKKIHAEADAAIAAKLAASTPDPSSAPNIPQPTQADLERLVRLNRTMEPGSSQPSFLEEALRKQELQLSPSWASRLREWFRSL